MGKCVYERLPVSPEMPECRSRCSLYLNTCLSVIRNGFVSGGECDMDFCEFCDAYGYCSMYFAEEESSSHAAGVLRKSGCGGRQDRARYGGVCMGSQEKIKEALSRIEEGLDAISTDEDWLRFITFQSSFYNYSFGNTMLIYMQNPEATYVKGYKAWNKLGRYVKKGETGIAILAPCFKKKDKEEEDKEDRIISGFRVAYVFDLAQTDGDDSQLPVLVKGLSGDEEREKEVYEKIKEYISSRQHFEEVRGTAAKGSYSPETGRIRVRSDMDHVQKIKTIIHEYAHCIDFALNPDKDISRHKRELIAESSAYIVSLCLGIDTAGYSMGYLNTWLKDRKEMKEIADTVQKISLTIISELAGVLGPAYFGLQEEPEYR